jgi:hypothetical protein
MRFDWLFSAALLVCMIGCADYGSDAVAPMPEGGDSAAPSPSSQAVDSETGQTANNTSWDLLDDTVLKVSVDPPLSADAKLQVRRRYDAEAHAPLKSLHYRVLTDAAPDAEWIVLPEPTKKDLGDGMFDSIYETAVTLPMGTASIQFKVDQGFGEPYELKDWNVEVK